MVNIMAVVRKDGDFGEKSHCFYCVWKRLFYEKMEIFPKKSQNSNTNNSYYVY